MSQLSDPIPKQPDLNPAEDYYRLRREGIGYIEQMGSRQWTDYNAHDPGITILESLCYAITDLAYRIGWDIKDVLAPADPRRPYPNQPFFTARSILTVNPWTPDDLRRVLIDRQGVRNAWVIGKECACGAGYYARCADGQLALGYEKQPKDATAESKRVSPKGLYDVLLELESDPESGDLNDRKLTHTYTEFDDDGNGHPVTVEVRFPDWGLAHPDDWRQFLDDKDAFADSNGRSIDLALSGPRLDRGGSAGLTDLQLQANWRSVLYARIEITLQPGGRKIAIDPVAVRLFGDTFARTRANVVHLQAILADKSSAGLVQRYRRKLLNARSAVADARRALQARRNLDEDFCCVKTVAVEDVAVCADIEVAPDADIERVQARIWFEIEQYFNPPIPFYSLRELQAAGVPVEDIFDGPALDNGFLKAEDLQASGLRTVLRVSDLVNRLMDIDGVQAVNNLMLTGYDDEGNVAGGAGSNSGAGWLLTVRPLHQPRLYHNLSRFLFFKNGLPFKPRLDEAASALVQLRGQAERPKIAGSSEDLPVPAGAFRSPEDYSPVQNGFPLAYGAGLDGLPSHVSDLRRAQARQLKAYLMVFEQLLGNGFAQLAHTADLFSLDTGVNHTYFFKRLDGSGIAGYDDIVQGLDAAAMETLIETRAGFLERRNRFLNHIMARFGEDFGEYALLLSNHQGQSKALAELIGDKIAFLADYPALSHDRARAIDYSIAGQTPGLARRVMRLLGLDPATEPCIVVEHLLLRPKFPGDALFPACSDGPCDTCGDEDPYSFRLTVVMPGWLKPFDTDLEMRRFADRTIRQETPAHLLAKICWVSNDPPEPGELTGWQFKRFQDAWRQWLVANAAIDWTEERLHERVEAILAGGAIPPEAVCQCALDILEAYGAQFFQWMGDTLRAGGAPSAGKMIQPKSADVCRQYSIPQPAAAAVDALLADRYGRYIDASHRLWIVTGLLAQLRNSYPVATLHDCDDGQDRNPIRLGQTALGSIL